MYQYIVLCGYMRILGSPSVAPHRYLLPTVYLVMADITNPDCSCVIVGPIFVSTLPAFIRSSPSHPAAPHGRLDHKRSRIELVSIAGWEHAKTKIKSL